MENRHINEELNRMKKLSGLINENENASICNEVIHELKANGADLIDATAYDGTDADYVVELVAKKNAKYSVMFFIKAEVEEKPYYRPSTHLDPEEGSEGLMYITLVRATISDLTTEEVVYECKNGELNSYFNEHEEDFQRFLSKEFEKSFQDMKDYDRDRKLNRGREIDEVEIPKNDIPQDDDIRHCSECGSDMNQGYVINGGMEYYCDDECLHKHYTPDEWAEMYGNGETDSYWTQWEEGGDQNLPSEENMVNESESKKNQSIYNKQNIQKMEKQTITESRIREIISEEATRMKKRIMLEAEKKKILKRLNEMYQEETMEDEGTCTECGGSEMEEGFMDKVKGALGGGNPEEKRTKATAMINGHPSYKKTPAWVAQKYGIDVNMVFQKLVDFIVANGLQFPAGGVQWDNTKQIFVDKTVYTGAAPGMQGAAEE